MHHLIVGSGEPGTRFGGDKMEIGSGILVTTFLIPVASTEHPSGSQSITESWNPRLVWSEGPYSSSHSSRDTSHHLRLHPGAGDQDCPNSSTEFLSPFGERGNREQFKVVTFYIGFLTCFQMREME